MADYVFASIICTIENFSVNSVTILDGGSGYENPYIEFGIPSSGGLQALAEATIDSNGSIIAISLVSGGSGYFEAPTVKVFDLTGATLPNSSIAGWDTAPSNDSNHNFYVVSSYDLYRHFQLYVPVLTFLSTIETKADKFQNLSEDIIDKKITISNDYSLQIGDDSIQSGVSTNPLSFTRQDSSFSPSKQIFALGSAYFPSASNGRFVLTNINSIASQLNGDFTVEGWFYPTQDAGTEGNYQTLFCSNTTNKTGFFIDFENTGGGRVIQAYLGEQNSNSYRQILIGNIVNRSWEINEWNHWALTYSTINGWDLFLNGRLVALDPSTVISSNWLTTWTLGCRLESNQFSLGINQGYLQHIRVSNIVRYSTASRLPDDTYVVPTTSFSFDTNTVYLNTMDQISGFNLSLSQINQIINEPSVEINATESIFSNSITLLDVNKNPTVRISKNEIYFF